MKLYLFSSKIAAVILFLFSAANLIAGFVDQNSAESLVLFKMSQDDMTDSRVIDTSYVLESDLNDQTLAYVFELKPTGYMIVPAEDRLFPILAYSYENGCRIGEENSNPLFDLVKYDIEKKISCLEMIPGHVRERFKSWRIGLLEGRLSPDFEQWPPSGSTPTGGWLESNWTQNSPYNDMCPTDPVQGGTRCVAGCPAVAMGMIVNFQESIHSTHFSDSDDYYHSYGGRNYWIDDDWSSRGFPSWSQLNVYLDTLESHYNNDIQVTNQDKVALTWACGAAMRQVYTYNISGTFGATQAYQAYIKFGYTDCHPLDTLSDSLYERLSQNMKDGKPAHIAALTSTLTAGHNFVIDGYNTNDYYHLNMGWGGTYNGWYLLPQEIPYDLTVVDTIIVDIGLAHNPVEEIYENPLNLQVTSFIVTRFNPVLKFLCSMTTSGAEVRIFDLSGRTVIPAQTIQLTEGENSYALHLDDFGSGVYLMKISYGDFDSSFRFTVLE
ncbi:C10 family peptidase [candidate division WOR-3 bacterium]|nr:C10 family peptidase [candidate division WOR-3 bacterium]